MSAGERNSTAICRSALTTKVGGAPTSFSPSSAPLTIKTAETSAAATSLPEPPPLVATSIDPSVSTASLASDSVRSPEKRLNKSFTASIVTGGTLGEGGG